MFISMQGDWTVRVKSKSAAYKQQFVIQGANSGNGTHSGTVGTSVDVTGDQWSIAIQNNPGSGYQLSDTQLKFPRLIGGNYEFDIHSNDAGGDSDFNDLILTCSTPVNVNDFIVYGNVSLYSGRCIFNPCRKRFYVIETMEALKEAYRNPTLRKVLNKDYFERVRDDIIGPLPPDPPPFKPIVIDLFNRAAQPGTKLVYKRIANPDTPSKSKKEKPLSEHALSNYSLVNTIAAEASPAVATAIDTIETARAIEGLTLKRCLVGPAVNTTLSFEEYDRSAGELAGGPYTGSGDRRLLGNTITDMNGNYIFRFSFDMTFPNIEDTTDIAAGESINVVAYPDLIVKLTGFAPHTVLYESAPYYNIPNLKRIDLCLPKSTVVQSSACYNGNLIGSLGNLFLGGDQNTTASIADEALERHENGNYLEASGVISVGSPSAGFNVECASWHRTIDIKGCMYDLAKTASQNKTKWYTLRIRREGQDWQFVTQNYKHPKFHKRNIPGYLGDDVGPFPQTLVVDGVSIPDVPAYTNIQREIFVDGVDWEFSNFDRFMQLNTRLYDRIDGEHSPGKFYLRVDCYDNAGNPVANGTDMIALYIHNKEPDVALTAPEFPPEVENSGCGLFHLTDAQMSTPIRLSFKANDPDGFIHFFDLSTRRCPAPMIALTVNQPIVTTIPGGAAAPSHPTTPSGRTTLFNGISSSAPHSCAGYTGTILEFSESGFVTVEIQPGPGESGWIKPDESFTKITFYLRAFKRRTNGYNSGVSHEYEARAQILMERKDS
jgi:hypothetical protein